MGIPNHQHKTNHSLLVRLLVFGGIMSEKLIEINLRLTIEEIRNLQWAVDLNDCHAPNDSWDSETRRTLRDKVKGQTTLATQEAE